MNQDLNEHKNNDIDALALRLTTATSRFTRVAGRVPGVTHSVTAWRTLAALDSAGPGRVSELAAQERISQPTMTGLVQRLADEGLVERGPDPDDGRATRVTITANGSRALAEYRRAAAARIRPALDRLSDFDRATLARAAELLAEITDAPELAGA